MGFPKKRLDPDKKPPPFLPHIPPPSVIRGCGLIYGIISFACALGFLWHGGNGLLFTSMALVSVLIIILYYHMKTGGSLVGWSNTSTSQKKKPTCGVPGRTCLVG